MFLIDADIKQAIEADERAQITEADDSIMNFGISYATAEIASFLGQQFDMDYELRDVSLYNNSHAYSVDDRVSYNNSGTTSVYTCTVAGTGNAPTDPTHWKGDDRNVLLVSKCLDIAIFTIFRRINPRFESDLRMKRHNDAINWLRDVRDKNAMQPKLKKIIATPDGGRMRSGNGNGNQRQY